MKAKRRKPNGRKKEAPKEKIMTKKKVAKGESYVCEVYGLTVPVNEVCGIAVLPAARCPCLLSCQVDLLHILAFGELLWGSLQNDLAYLKDEDQVRHA